MTSHFIHLLTSLLLLAISSIATAPPFVKWPPDLAYPDCARLFDRSPASDADTEYIAKAAAQRVTHSDAESNLQWARSCRDYHSRGHYAQRPLSDEEAEFPLAFATTVFKDFDFLERIFSVMYAPQNVYCYVIDAKATDDFKKRLNDWAECFPNVVVPPVELEVRSSGHNVTAAQLACMRALDGFDWKYLILMQNHDMPLRSNAELVRILRIFNGTNDVSTLAITPTSVDPNATWTFDKLHLFRNESLNRAMLDNGRTEGRLYLTKSLVGVSLSRAMVDFVLHQLNVTGFIDQLERWSYGIDENFLSTLNSNELIGAPGGFTRACLLRGQPVSSITRYAVWGNHVEECRSGNFRHAVCLFGVEDLRYLMSRHQLFLNKMISSFDYGASMCWLEAIYNRTHFTRGGFDEPPPADNNLTSPVIVHPLHEAYYATLPTVRFNAQRRTAAGGSAPAPADNFFYQLLHQRADGVESELELQREERAGWHLMRSLYGEAKDGDGKEKESEEEEGSGQYIKIFSSRDLYVDKLELLEGGKGLAEIYADGERYVTVGGGFDYYNFNCTHPYRDYYF